MIGKWIEEGLNKFTKKTTDKVVVNTKESVREQVSKDIEKNLPAIIGIITLGVIMLQTRKKPITSTITIINNYYGGGR